MSGSFPGGLATGLDLEYRLSPAYRRPVLMRFILNSVLTVIMAASALGASGALHALLLLVGSVSGVIAVFCGVAYLWRGRFCTRVNGLGIEAKGYFNHFVPWSEVSRIEIGGYANTGGDRIRITRSGFTASTIGMGMASRSGKMARLDTVRVVRANGRKLTLTAPLVTGWAPDPAFADKAQQLQELSRLYAGSTATRP
jgi:hypothetical protein